MYENNDSAAPVLIGNQLFAADGKANCNPARAGTTNKWGGESAATGRIGGTDANGDIKVTIAGILKDQNDLKGIKDI